nr:TraB/GumN family protein [Thermomonas flagellata]
MRPPGAAAQEQPAKPGTPAATPAPQATPAAPAPADADAAAQAPQAAAPTLPSAAASPPLRGILFRVIPPAQADVPADTAVAADAGAPPAHGGSPATAPATPPPPPVSYLLGTIHFGTPEEQGLDYAALARTLDEVATFVNEADIDSAWQPAFDGYRWLPPQQPLSQLLGREDFARARALLPAVPVPELERMKPWSVLALLEARGERAGEATMDARLQRMAAAAGKRVQHLETLEQQLQALDCVPAAEQAQVLQDRLRASWVLRIESAKAMAYYRARTLEPWLADIERMDGLGEAARASELRARHCLLEERNARWIGQLQTLFQDGPCLVAVGAVHLVGPDGLIARLRRDGYRVEPVPL